MTVKKAHFIGIGGVGMSAVAKLLKDSGVAVSGSDEDVYPPISDFLAREGFSVRTPFAATNIPPDADLIVIGSSRATMRPETNQEVAAALKSGKELKSFPEVLAKLTRERENIVVAGSYGKSSTSALLAHVLEYAGLHPGYFIGAIPTEGSNAALGTGPLFVLEGDEYPTSNTDSRSKFLLMHPKQAIITPLAHDHFNVFATPEAYLKPFYELAHITPDLIVCTEGTLNAEFIARTASRATYGVHAGNYIAEDIAWGERTSFSVRGIRLETSLLGEHNIQNIVGVAAYVLEHGLMSQEQLAAGIGSFKGVKRRLDRKSEATSIPVYEGFGSSVEKLRSAIAAMKLHFPARRLLVVFEPHTFSWRNRESLPWYDTAFAGAAGVYVFEPPQDGKEDQLSLSEITARIAAAGISTYGAHTTDELLKRLAADLQQNDCILLSSSGAMGGLVDSITKLAEQKFPV